MCLNFSGLYAHHTIASTSAPTLQMLKNCQYAKGTVAVLEEAIATGNGVGRELFAWRDACPFLAPLWVWLQIHRIRLLQYSKLDLWHSFQEGWHTPS